MCKVAAFSSNATGLKTLPLWKAVGAPLLKPFKADWTGEHKVESSPELIRLGSRGQKL